MVSGNFAVRTRGGGRLRSRGDELRMANHMGGGGGKLNE